jgi:hypothetical protein
MERSGVSTILKALKRLEEEKSKSAERPLDEQIVAPDDSPMPKNRAALIALAMIGGIAVGSSALYFWPEGSETVSDTPALDSATATTPSPPKAKPPVELSSSAEIESERQANKALEIEKMKKVMASALEKRGAVALESPTAPSGSENPVAEPESQATATMDLQEMMKALEAATQRRKAADIEQVAVETQAPLESDPAMQKADQQIGGQGNQSRRPRRSNRSSEDAMRVEQIEKVAHTEPMREHEVAATPAPPVLAPVKQSEEEVSPEPPLSALDAKVVRRIEVPPVRVNKAVWHPDAARRHAFVTFAQDGEALKLREGDAIGPLVVKSIKPGGVLFYHDGVEIRYNVGDN